MASPLKTLVLRMPHPAAARRTTSLVRCCPRSPAFSTTVRPICLARAPVRHQSYLVPTVRLFVRPNSNLASAAQKSVNAASKTTASKLASTPQSSSSSRPSPALPAGHEPLSWDSFFKLRMRRRRVQLAFSIVCSIGACAGGAIVLSAGVAEPLVKLIPLDPFLTLGLMAFACAALGWLAGPSVGGALYYMGNRKLKPQMKVKESEFLEKVKTNRADPTNSSAANPGMSKSFSVSSLWRRVC